MNKTASIYANDLITEYDIHKGKIDMDDFIHHCVDSENLAPQEAEKLQLAIIEKVLIEMHKRGDTLTDKHLTDATGLTKQALKRLLGLGGTL